MTTLALFPDIHGIDKETLKTWTARLAAGDRYRAGEIRGDERRREFIVSRTLLASLARNNLGLSVQVLSSVGEPPRLLTRDGEHIACSISHSKDAVLVGMNTGGSIGVDVERHGTRALDKLVKRYFWTAGYDYFAGQSPAAGQSWFYREWCVREALLKCHGQGNLLRLLGAPLQLPSQFTARVGQTTDLTIAAVFEGSGYPDVVVARADACGDLIITPPEPSAALPLLYNPLAQ